MRITKGLRACVRPKEWLTCNKATEVTDGSGMRLTAIWFFKTQPLAGVGSATSCRPTNVSDSLRTAPNQPAYPHEMPEPKMRKGPMRHSTWGRVLAFTSLVLGCLSLAASAVHAAEQSEEFLERLRERGYYDTALEYLEQLKTSPLCSKEMKEKLDYEVGVTLMGLSRTAGAAPKRETILNQARDQFQKFMKEHPKHPLAGTAGSQCANVLVEQGRLKMEAVGKANTPAEEKKKLTEGARALYQEAKKVFETTEKFWYDEARKYEGKKLDPRKDASDIERRDLARRELVQARLFLAQVMYEIGKTYDPKAKEFAQWLGDAAKKYNELYTKYGQLVGGLYARVWEGRIYTELGQNDKAIAAFKDMLILPDEVDAFRNLKLQSLAHMVEVYTKTKKYSDATAAVEKWAKDARAEDESSEYGLKVHYLTGLATLEQAKTLKEGDAQIAKLRSDAKKHFEYVSRFAGEYQRDARAKAAELSGVSLKDVEPTDYPTAKERGDFEWQNVVLAMGQVEQAKTKQEQAKLADQLKNSVANALKYYRMAVAFKTKETNLDEVNLIRFRMAFLYWRAEDLQRAALMGEFLARRYSTHVAARKGGEIAVKAYRKLFTDALQRKEDTASETEQVNRIAQYITKRWPNDPEAEEAWSMLIDTAVDNRDVAKAMEFLEQIPKDSPKRAQAELRTGEALWRAYAQAANLQGDARPPQEQLDKMVKQAQAILEEGVTRAKKSAEAGGDVNYSLAYCVLSLANIYVGTGQADKAVTCLEDPKIGPLTLQKAKSPILQGREQFTEAVYNTALQAYVGVQQLDKAEQTMAALEESVGKDAEGSTKLTQIYIRLGRQLEETLMRLRNEGKTDDAKKVAGGFEVFLKKIAERKEGNTFGSLYWVAETFYSMGAAAKAAGKSAEEEANQYFTEAFKTYVAILKRLKEDESFAPPRTDEAIKVRLAICLREMGKFENAMKIIVPMLKEKENRLDIQQEAARVYQAWGKEKPAYYEYAIKGGNPEGGRYIIWGWGGIAKRVMAFMGTNKKYDEMFFEARFNLADCRLSLADSQSGQQKKDTLVQAEKDVTIIYRLYPSMGGPEWFAKYDKLLKDVQKMQGVKPEGLKGLESALPKSKTTTSSKQAASK